MEHLAAAAAGQAVQVMLVFKFHRRDKGGVGVETLSVAQLLEIGVAVAAVMQVAPETEAV
jgi:hypothetical protein